MGADWLFDRQAADSKAKETTDTVIYRGFIDPLYGRSPAHQGRSVNGEAFSQIRGIAFGLQVGLVSCILFVSILRVSAYGRQSILRKILALGFFGALAGFPILFPFGDGFAMAIALGFESASFGTVIGAVIGIVVFLVVRNERENPIPGVRPDEKAEGG